MYAALEERVFSRGRKGGERRTVFRGARINYDQMAPKGEQARIPLRVCACKHFDQSAASRVRKILHESSALYAEILPRSKIKRRVCWPLKCELFI